MEGQNSSAYSSLANSSTDIHDKMSSNGQTYVNHVPGSANSSLEEGRCIDQMRNITQDYNVLLKKATDEIKGLVNEKYKVQEECEKLMSANEDLVQEMSRLVKREKALKAENEAVLKANSELFAEAQRLNDEEAVWLEARSKLEAEVTDLRSKVENIEAGLRGKGQEDQLEVEVTTLRSRVKSLEAEKDRLDQSKLESEVHRLRNRLRVVETEKESLERSKAKVSGENMQLMVEADDQAKVFRQKSVTLQSQVKKLEDKCRDLERENARLRNASLSAQNDAKLNEQQAEKFEKLLEKNKNLTDWREQLIAKNKVLNEENAKLKSKCQNLEDLLNEEETDINDVLELIKKMQVNGGPGGSGSPGGGPGSLGASGQLGVNPGPMLTTKYGPISKFRDLQFK